MVQCLFLSKTIEHPSFFKMIKNIIARWFPTSDKQCYSWLPKWIPSWIRNDKYAGSMSFLSTISTKKQTLL